MSPERIYLRHYNDSQTSPIDPHTLRLWRLGDGDIEYVRADLACPTPSLEAIDILDLAKALKSRMDSKRIETYGFAGFAATIKPEMFEAPTPSLAAAPDLEAIAKAIASTYYDWGDISPTEKDGYRQQAASVIAALPSPAAPSEAAPDRDEEGEAHARPAPSLRPVDLDDYDKDRDPMGWFNG